MIIDKDFFYLQVIGNIQKVKMNLNILVHAHKIPVLANKHYIEKLHVILNFMMVNFTKHRNLFNI